MTQEYGKQDISFQAAGGEEGIRRLVDAFYDEMDQAEYARTVREMHPKDLAISRDKLARFLCGWLGGPRLYAEKYGGISIPAAHAHLDIGLSERDAWLGCMKTAIDQQDYAPEFKRYLLEQLSIPAERVRKRD
ncbi:MAG: group II truncated hemoglobin [Gammaproteobacteria bacterium]